MYTVIAKRMLIRILFFGVDTVTVKSSHDEKMKEPDTLKMLNHWLL